MYFIIDNTTGEVLADASFKEDVIDLIEDLTAMYPYERLEVWDGETSIPADEWDD